MLASQEIFSVWLSLTPHHVYNPSKLGLNYTGALSSLRMKALQASGHEVGAPGERHL
jgi:hypothetical protein